MNSADDLWCWRFTRPAGAPVCGDQMALYSEVLDEFQQFQAELIGISSTAHGVMRLLPGKRSCAFGFWPISNRKERSPPPMVFTTKKTAFENAPYS